MNTFFEILELTYPVIFSIILVLLAIFSKFSSKKKELSINLPFFSVPYAIKQKNVFRIIYLIFSVFFLVFVFVRDYSSFFPTRLSFDIFYDKQGLNQTIIAMQKIDEKLIISNDWILLRNHYFQKMDSILAHNFPSLQRIFTNENALDYLVSHGKAEHEIEYFGFWQKYKISKVSGITQHTLHLPAKEPIGFQTKYNLLEKSENLIIPSLKDFFNFEIIVQPTMAQSLMIHSTKIYETELIGITHCIFFPYNSVEKTIFSFRAENGLVPLGYTYYREED